MTIQSYKNVLLAVLRKKVKASTLAFFYIVSLFFILRSGVFFQYFTTEFNQRNCYECSMKIDYIKHFYFSFEIIYHFPSVVIIFIASLFIRKRLQSYLSMLVVIWVVLTLTDLVISIIGHSLSLGFIVLNLIYNLAGAVLLSFFVSLSNSTIFYLHKIKGVSIFLASMIPFIVSIAITLFLTTLVYLLYARQSVEIEVDVAEGANIAYVGAKNNEESFGFLNDKETNTPTYIDVMKKGEVIYKDEKGVSSADIFIVSGCYAIPGLLENPPVDKRKTILNTKFIAFKQDFPMTGYIQGDSINVIPHGASQLSLTKDDKQYMIASRITNSSIEFDSKNSKITAAFNLVPIKEDDYLNEYTYDIIINDRKYTVVNIIEPLSRLDKNKKMKCVYQQLSADELNYVVKGKYLTGILISVMPDDIIVFKNSPSLTLKASYAFYKKTYPNPDKIYDDISNGKLTSFRATGLTQLTINGKKQDIRPESDVIISSESLFGLVNKSRKIKIYGTADLVFVDNKILNVRKITYVQSKLAIFGSSVFDIFKYLFSLGFIAVVLRFVYFYFKNESSENLFF